MLLIKISQYSQENTCEEVSFQYSYRLEGLLKTDYFRPATLLNRLQHVFFSEYCKIFINTYFEEYLRKAFRNYSTESRVDP